MYFTNKLTSVNDIGGKAYNLLKLNIRNTPALYVLKANFFTDLELNDGLKTVLKQEINSLFLSNKLYAVRSSGLEEDSDEYSFAGVHDSILYVKKEDIYDAIFKVYASRLKTIALSYRKNNNLSLENIKMAVIVQEMIDPDFAGVINTINPITNNPDEVVISVVTGCGEKLVNGEADSSDYIINGKNIICNGPNILSSKIINKIIKMIKEITDKSESFLDIEYAVKNNIVYFLQARNIVNYKDINPHKRTLLLDNANIIESYYGKTSYLTYTFAKCVYEEVYKATLRYGHIRESIIIRLEESLSNMLEYYDGKIYYNMNSWYHVTSIFPFASSKGYMENMMGVKSTIQKSEKVKMNIFDVIKLGVIFLNKLKNIDKISDEFEDKFDRIVLPHYGKKITGTNEGLNALYKEIEVKIVSEFAVPIVNDCAVMIYYGKLTNKINKLKIDNKAELLNYCVSSEGNVKSAGSAKDLINIVSYIKNDANLLDDFTELDVNSLYIKYHSTTKDISNMINKYIYDFGARVCDELKLETITMIEDEKLAYKIIKEALLNNIKMTATNNEVEIPHNIKNISKKACKFIKNRERLRLKRTYVYSVVRNIFLAFGENYKKMGRINDERDVFFLSKEEVLTGVGDFKELVKQRKETYNNYSEDYLDRIAFYGEKVLPVYSSINKEGLIGTPSGNGVVKANVSLLNSPACYLKPGNIILTKRTDPGWISLFPSASGLIVEHGSMLSHSFIVARELGLPAIVGVKDATKKIKNNQLVTLDGLKGEITIED